MMREPILNVYYDNPNKASDMYLKYLTKTCMEKGIKLKVFNDSKQFFHALKEDDHGSMLLLEPMIHESVKEWCNNSLICNGYNVDSPSATASGILQHIVNNYDRDACIGVIGRGLVGKQLIDMLIKSGYTVIEMNSKTPYKRMEHICFWECNVVVGLANSDEPIFDNRVCDKMTSWGIELIDASNNFNTEYKLRCGKWTRELIAKRVIDNYEHNVANDSIKEIAENDRKHSVSDDSNATRIHN